jgi:hypothetical protein
VPDPFYNVVLDGPATDGAPLMRLQSTDALELKVGSKIPIPVLSFEADPRPLGGIIASIDGFARLDDLGKQAAIGRLREYQPQSRWGEILRIDADSEPGCLGRLVVREVAPPPSNAADRVS